MWGDLKVWSGTKEVTLFSWWERVWRFLTRRNGGFRYTQVANRMLEQEKLMQQALVNEALSRYSVSELEYGELRKEYGGESD